MRFLISIAVIVALSIVFFVIGTNLRGQPSIQTRIDTTIKDGQEAYRAYSRAPGSVQAVVLHRTLTYLKTATPKSIATGHLLIAYLVQRPGKRNKLVVNWIGATPDMKKVRITPDLKDKSISSQKPTKNKTSNTIDLPVPPGQKVFNKSQAYSKVIYTIMLKLDKDSKANAILKNAGKNHVYISLVRLDGKTTNQVICFIAQKGKIIEN